MKVAGTEWKPVELTALGAFALHFVVAMKYPTLTWCDEIFQTLEQGHRLAFGNGVIPWEFREAARSWVLPGVLGGVMKATSFFGSGSSGYLLGVRLFLTALSVLPAVSAVALAEREKLERPWLAGAAVAVWFELVYLSSKALTEVVAAYALAVALYFCISREKPRAMVWAGLAWGLAVGLRIHLLPAALVAMAWTCRKDLALWKQQALGFSGVLLVFGLVDWATWSYPFQSFVTNIWVNVAKGKASSFGVTPPWEYLRSAAFAWSWGALPLLGFAALGFRRQPLLGIVALVIFLSHSVIPHKEYRFLVPCLVLVVMAAGLGLAQLVAERRDWGLAACAVFLVASADGARRFELTGLAPKLEMEPIPMWTVRTAELIAYEQLSKTDDVCGVGSVALGWGYTGGYTYLHKDVPMFEIRTKTQMAEHEKQFNYLIANRTNNGEKIGLFDVETCWGALCLYKRPGPCDSPGDYTFNAFLAATGM